MDKTQVPNFPEDISPPVPTAAAAVDPREEGELLIAAMEEIDNPEDPILTLTRQNSYRHHSKRPGPRGFGFGPGSGHGKTEEVKVAEEPAIAGWDDDGGSAQESDEATALATAEAVDEVINEDPATHAEENLNELGEEEDRIEAPAVGFEPPHALGPLGEVFTNE